MMDAGIVLLDLSLLGAMTVLLVMLGGGEQAHVVVIHGVAVEMASMRERGPFAGALVVHSVEDGDVLAVVVDVKGVVDRVVAGDGHVGAGRDADDGRGGVAPQGHGNAHGRRGPIEDAPDV